MHKISLNTNSNQGIVLHKFIRRFFKNKSTLHYSEWMCSKQLLLYSD